MTRRTARGGSRTICVINGKRGGFNALLPTMNAIAGDRALRLQVVLTDMHLSETFGRTLDYAQTHVRVTRTVPIAQTGASAVERTDALGRALSGMASALDDLRPDMVLILGDRSETLVAAVAALQLRIPIAHVQGGEISGNIDGIQRHAITKLAHIHFAETERAKRRLLRMGEEPWRVSRVGAPYIDFIRLRLYTPAAEVRQKYELAPDEPFLLVLQHPVTTEPDKSYVQMVQVLDAVKATGFRAIVAYPCSDQGYQGIIDAIEERGDDRGLSIHRNIPAEDFIGLEATASALVGNSSAGIYEAPYVYCPFVNVGERQRGREREPNVIDVPPRAAAIRKAVQLVHTDVRFRKRLRQPKHIYGDGRAYQRIVRTLKQVPLGARLFEKALTY
jgi:GDP/UDP-N,N'-diacetylbacillosamine 2-epimerase (hydrolysing)